MKDREQDTGAGTHHDFWAHVGGKVDRIVFTHYATHDLHGLRSMCMQAEVSALSVRIQSAPTMQHMISMGCEQISRI